MLEGTGRKMSDASKATIRSPTSQRLAEVRRAADHFETVPSIKKKGTRISASRTRPNRNQPAEVLRACRFCKILRLLSGSRSGCRRRLGRRLFELVEVHF